MSSTQKETSTTDSVNDSHQSLEGDIETKLKGDAIGNTMYTESFVLKTILKLKELEWNEELEDDLCFLWDSTIEKEVCDYLLSNHFPSIACAILAEHSIEHGRLYEILVGILANLIIAKCTKEFTREQIHFVLNLLDSTDSLVLIQVMRFIIAASHNCENFEIFIDEKYELVESQFRFILNNSLNFELLQKTLEALSKMTNNSKVIMFFKNDMLNLAVNNCIRSVTEDGENEFELFSNEQRTTVKFLVEYVLNFTVYVNENNDSVTSNMKNFADIYLNFFIKVCKWYSLQENLLPITDEILFYFEATNYIFLTLHIEYCSELFKNIALILKLLVDNECEEINEFIEICCYFIEIGGIEEIKRDLTSIDGWEKLCIFLEKKELALNFNFHKSKLKAIYQITE